QLGSKWPELLDQVAGGGLVIAAKLGDNPASSLLVMQSKDEASLRKFIQTVRTLIEQELARQESKDKFETAKYRDQEVFRIGQDFHAAVAGSALLIRTRKSPCTRRLIFISRAASKAWRMSLAFPRRASCSRLSLLAGCG